MNGEYEFKLSRDGSQRFEVNINFKINENGEISHDEISIYY